MIVGYQNGVIDSDKALKELVTQMRGGEGRFSGMDGEKRVTTLVGTLMNGETVGYAAIVATRRNNADPEKTRIRPDDAVLLEALNAPIRDAFETIGADVKDKDQERGRGVSDEKTLVELAEQAEDLAEENQDGDADTDDVAEDMFRNELMRFLTVGYAKELSGLGSDAPLHTLTLEASKEGVRVARNYGLLGYEQEEETHTYELGKKACVLGEDGNVMEIAIPDAWDVPGPKGGDDA